MCNTLVRYFLENYNRVYRKFPFNLIYHNMNTTRKKILPSHHQPSHTDEAQNQCDHNIVSCFQEHLNFVFFFFLFYLIFIFF